MRITQKAIGLIRDLIFDFDIPKSVPESYDDPLEGLDPTLEVMTITPRYSETENILFVSDIWDYDATIPSSAFKSFPVKFERNGDFGKITFKILNGRLEINQIVEHVSYQQRLQHMLNHSMERCRKVYLCLSNQILMFPTTKINHGSR